MNKIYKTVLGATAVTAGIAAVSLTPAIVSAWGDNSNGRDVYTLDQINSGALGDKITFNSITNDGVIGDERNFVGAKVSGAKVDTWNANTINVQDGGTYTIRMYVHNNSPKGTAAIAENVKATASIPTTVAKEQAIIGYIDSSNATPTRVWDEVKLVADENVYLEFVEGSAKYNNNVGHFNLPNELITSGVTLGYTTMDGKIPGCFEYSGVVTFDVKVHSSVTSKLTKKVRIKGTTEWQESVDAKVGDEVEYQIGYTNLLSEQVNNVMIRDVLPTNVEYVNDTTYLYNSNYKNGVKLAENTVATSGINIGNYAAKANAYVRFTGKVVDKTMACGNNQLVNWASATVNGEVYKDDASVMVAKTCENTPDTPSNPKTDTNEATTASTPSTIVNTGPETIVAGALGTGGVTTALGYFISSRKKLM